VLLSVVCEVVAEKFAEWRKGRRRKGPRSWKVEDVQAVGVGVEV